MSRYLPRVHYHHPPIYFTRLKREVNRLDSPKSSDIVKDWMHCSKKMRQNDCSNYKCSCRQNHYESSDVLLKLTTSDRGWTQSHAAQINMYSVNDNSFCSISVGLCPLALRSLSCLHITMDYIWLCVIQSKFFFYLNSGTDHFSISSVS